MKNALGKKESLKLYNDKGGLVYKFHRFYKDYDRDWYKLTYDDNGNELTFKNSDGRWYEYTRDDNCNRLTYKDSNGFWCESTYDDQGKELTFKDSDGVKRGFDIPEYTMEQLTQMIGKEFKIKKQ